MRIKKILNNNVITFESSSGEDNIAMGRGIAYGKRVGDEVEKDKIDNIFVPDSTMKDVTSLIESIPYEYFQIADKILKYARIVIAKPINSRAILFLADHIYGAVERAKEGIFLKTTLYWEVKRFYKDEFLIAQYGLDLIKEELDVKLDNSEAAFIALNLANSMNNNSADLYQTTKIMKEIIDIIRREFMVELQEDSVNYYRFINHLKFFSSRLVSGQTYSDNKDDDLLEIIKYKYVNSYKVAVKINGYLERNYSYRLSNEEILYLTIHIERIIYRTGD